MSDRSFIPGAALLALSLLFKTTHAVRAQSGEHPAQLIQKLD